MNSVARYDGLADWYDEFVQSADVVTDALASLAGMVGRGPGQCLDVGCGTGMAFATLARHDWTVVGVDVSADQLAVAQDRARAVGARLIHADASELPFADGTFDAVVSVLTHTDFDDLPAVVREAVRVLAPGGRFVYVGVHPCFVGPMVERRADGPHLMHPGYRRAGWWADPEGPVRSKVGVNHIPLAQLMNAVLDAGLRLEQIEEPGNDGYPMLLSLRARGPSAPN